MSPLSIFLAETCNRATIVRTEELLAPTGLLNDLDKTRLQLLDGRNVLGEDAHLARLSGDVDLDAALY